MNKNLDLTTILKDCPNGMELDCLMYEDVYFDYVDELNIIHCYIQHETHKTSLTFNQHGTPSSDIKSKCVIFPKGKISWEGFQRPFEDGDIIVDKQGTIAIYKQVHKSYEEPCVDFHCRIYHGNKNLFHTNIIKGSLEHCGEIDSARFATEEEKAKLFDTIKANGYKWNNKTKTLEKLIVPKFNVGDRITNGKTSFTIGYIDNEYYYEIGKNIANRLFFKNQDEWELVPNKFDPKTLKPFDKVLVRDIGYNMRWHIQFFESIHEYNKDYPFMCLGGKLYSFCIPYNDDTKHLIEKLEEAPEFYRYWEK